MSSKAYEYEDIKSLSQNPDPHLVLIDVREPTEFQEETIPGSINIPYRSCPRGLTMDPEIFLKTFGIAKPSHDKELVFFCASGRRASEALTVAVEAGYREVSLYEGSMKDWIFKGRGRSP